MCELDPAIWHALREPPKCPTFTLRVTSLVRSRKITKRCDHVLAVTKRDGFFLCLVTPSSNLWIEINRILYETEIIRCPIQKTSQLRGFLKWILSNSQWKTRQVCVYVRLEKMKEKYQKKKFRYIGGSLSYFPKLLQRTCSNVFLIDENDVHESIWKSEDHTETPVISL